jgi:hypothetical protein
MGLPGDLVKAIREELTSGDANTKKLLADLLLSMVLKDSTGAELSSYVKSLGNSGIIQAPGANGNKRSREVDRRAHPQRINTHI